MVDTLIVWGIAIPLVLLVTGFWAAFVWLGIRAFTRGRHGLFEELNERLARMPGFTSPADRPEPTPFIPPSPPMRREP